MPIHNRQNHCTGPALQSCISFFPLKLMVVPWVRESTSLKIRSHSAVYKYAQQSYVLRSKSIVMKFATITTLYWDVQRQLWVGSPFWELTLMMRTFVETNQSGYTTHHSINAICLG